MGRARAVVTNIRTLTFSFSFHEGAKMNGSIDIAGEAAPIYATAINVF